MPDFENLQSDLDLVTELTVEAGKIALGWFGEDPKVWMKEGQSPVSEADFAVDKFLKENLLAARPDYGWLSEETDDTDNRMEKKKTFVVDPIDGTRGFINGMRRWCVSVAIVEENRPVVGVLECPAMKQTIAAAVGMNVRLNGEILLAQEPDVDGKIRVAGPRSIQTELFNSTSRPVEKSKFIPSLAYRIAMVAQGQIDLALARGSAKDWDLAAADLIVHEAGARLTNVDGDALRYNCADIRHGSLVASHSKNHDEMLDLAQHAMNKHNLT